MSQKTFPAISGYMMRGTRLDACGRPAYGDRAQIASEGFVSIAITANYDDGNEVSVTNAQGKKCVQRAAKPTLTGLQAALTFCNVDPEFYTMVTGALPVYDRQSGDVVGFRRGGTVDPHDVKWALEVWLAAIGDSGCDDDDADLPWVYDLLPFLTGGRVGDYTIEDNAVTFEVTDCVTNRGSQWGVGPYKVVRDESGDPDYLSTPIGPLDDDNTERTTVAPPADTYGLIPLDDPTGTPSTGAAAGSPGHFTPTGSIRPANLTALQGGSITAAPSTAWTTGQKVILGDGSVAHWTGTAWAAGKA